MKKAIILCTLILLVSCSAALVAGCQQQTIPASTTPETTTSPSPEPEPTPTAPVTTPDVVLFISDAHFINISISPSFQWGGTSGAERYEFRLAKDEEFSIIVANKTGPSSLSTTTYKCERDLHYNTTYYWQVRAINREGYGEWTGGVFTTVSGPHALVTAPSLPGRIPAPPEIVPLLLAPFEIAENTDVYRVRDGMVLDEDFTFDEDYYANFVKLWWSKQIIITPENYVYFDPGRSNDPYFILVCYPTTDVNSEAVCVCFKHDKAQDVDKVIAFFKWETMDCIRYFGGTPGTQKNGWVAP